MLDEKEVSFSVVVPAFNEDGSLESILQRTHSVLRSLGNPYELIVVDDGSTDRTAAIALSCGAKLVSNGENLGKGSALRKGFHQASGQVIVTLDGDGENKPEEIPRLLDAIMSQNDRVDVVIGSRFAEKTGSRCVSGLHFVGNSIINVTMALLLGMRLTDSQSGFRALKRDVLKDLTLKSEGYEIEAEMTARMLKKGRVIKEVPITYTQRSTGVSKVVTFKDGFKILRTIIQVFLTE
jgi:glycosyltransferase involved in cell wall biosynthesis